MKKGMKEMAATLCAIEKVIHTSSKKPTKIEAAQRLRSCGILDSKNNIKTAYKEILVSQSKKK